jgi:hypothetical protein
MERNFTAHKTKNAGGVPQSTSPLSGRISDAIPVPANDIEQCAAVAAH